MGLVLSSDDQSHLTSTLTAMLSPLASPTPEHWFTRITSELKQLLHCDSSQVALVLSGTACNFSADSPTLADSLESATSFRGGELHFHDSVMELGLVQRRRRQMSAFTSSLIDHSVGGKRLRSTFYNDVCVPARALETYGLMVIGPEGEAMVGVNCGAHPRFDPLGGDTLGLLQIVLPALQSGFETLLRVRSALSVLTATLDTLDVGMLAFDASTGRELHRNLAAASLLASAHEPASIVMQAQALARALRFHGACDDRALGEGAWRATNARSGGTEYRMRGTLLPPGSLGESASILITVERTSPQLPSSATLQEAIGLTAREADVTIRLAEGHDDAMIARALGISVHTVGHHVERIFIKLGIRSRKALGMSLLKLMRQSRP